MRNVFFIFIGGGLGSTLRYAISYFFAKNQGNQFPWATFVANGLGCLVIGLLFGYFQKNNVQNDSLKLFLTVGFCGGFTTFSALSLENFQFIQNQHYNLATIYTTTSLVIGLLAVYAGFKLSN
ncbi:fluoride efflux transporter CrcB [Flavobacterium sp. 20NA77.7]|jgi:CrcB protein|uniref:Fluoride-specific ion channel FluC n=1 Tax=Flavobacterium nakdongensis TaxID=3073563 RepID=A0ABY9R8M4_9FLAO|nr:fluoride efflux transporter CrcB [Flavobacterium sp. 20NA77.7]WMW77188.1 fluoride efflux transporter CrcB [Flavobacterium sp. 20NA77.7]